MTEQSETPLQSRYHLWDSLRGIALLLMVIFHFCYDLRYFSLVEWDVPNGSGWWQFRYLILTLFLGTVGVSMALAHGRCGVRWSAFWRRQLAVGSAALAISLGSLLMFPNSWIYFGVLHYIFLASLLCLPLLGRPLLALTLGLGILVLYSFDQLSPFWPFAWFAHWLPRYTEDFVPLFPWLGVTWLGLAAGHYPQDVKRKFGDLRLPVLCWAGRHSLIIYLLHQPILFALLGGALYLTGKI